MPNKITQNKNGLFEIKGVEIFSAGTWNGDKYDVEDLDKMIVAFSEMEKGFRPPLKLGHDEKQKMLQKDGLPAAGWVGSIYRKGEKLFADFIDIPKKIAELIKNKSYRKVSAEIYWNLSVNEKKFPFVLGAVSLLGADNPGVMNLDDILGLFNITKDKYEIKNYANVDEDAKVMMYDVDISIENGGNDMPTIEELQKQLNEKDAELKKFAQIETTTKETVEKLQKEKAEQLKEIETLRQEKIAGEVKAFTAELKSEKLCTPAMEKHIEEMLIEPEKKEYSLSENQKGTKQQAIKEMLKLFKAACEVNFDEQTVDGEKDSKKEDETKTIETEIAKYMADNKCDHLTAYKAVMKTRAVENTDDQD